MARAAGKNPYAIHDALNKRIAVAVIIRRDILVDAAVRLGGYRAARKLSVEARKGSASLRIRQRASSF